MTRRGRIVVTLVLAVPVALAALVTVGPRLVDWRFLVPRIAETLRATSGLELRVDGPVSLELVPEIRIRAEGLRILPAEGFPEPTVAVAAVRARIAPWPALRGALAVEELVVTGLDVALEVDATGARSWVGDRATERAGSDAARAGDADPPQETVPESAGRIAPADLSLGDVRIDGGTLRYRDARSGQSIAGRDLELSLSLTGLDHPLVLSGSATLNDQALRVAGRIEPFRAALERAPSRLLLRVDSTHLAARLEADVQTVPMLGLDGTGTVDIPSVGALASWLDAPLETNPGPLRARARFSSEGAKVALEEAVIEGDHLSAEGSASIELRGDEVHVLGELSAGVLDLDRYLPAREPAGEPEPPASMAELREAYLAAVPDTPLDLRAFDRLVAELSVRIGGIRLRGYELGPIHVEARASGGRLEVVLGELGAYAGTVSGTLRLETRGDRLAASIAVDAADVDATAIASVGAPEAPPVSGTASGRLELRAEGRSPKALAQGVLGKMVLALAPGGRVQGLEGLSALSLVVERPGLDARVRLAGAVTYAGEALEFDVSVDPLDTVLSGQPVDLEAEVVSELVRGRYAGTVYHSPVPSLAGTLDVATPSPARLARWLGHPLGAEPGPLRLQGTFESDGRTGTAREVRLSGEGVELSATGRFDSRGDAVDADLDVAGATLDIAPYLPGDGRGSAGGTRALLASLPDEPLGLDALQLHSGRLAVALDGLRIPGFETGPVTLVATLDAGALDLRLDRLSTPGGVLAGSARVEGAGDALRVQANARLAELPAERLRAAVAPLGSLPDATTEIAISASSRGSTLRRLATGATITVDATLPRLELDAGPFASLDRADATIEIPGIDARLRVVARGTLAGRDREQTYPLEVRGRLGTLEDVLDESAALPLDLTASIGETTLTAEGEVAAPTAAELDVSLRSPRLSALWMDTAGTLADVGPVDLAGTLSAGARRYRVLSLEARVGRSDLAGSATVSLEGERPRVNARLRSEHLDLSELVPYEPAAEGDDPAAPMVFPDDPLPLDALGAANGELGFEIARLTLDIGTEIDQVTGTVTLEDGRLEASPLEGSYKGGRTEAHLVLDTGESPARFELRGEEHQMLLGTFVPLVKPDGESLGRADVDLRASGTGDSPREIASGLDGHLRVIGEGGAVDSRMLGTLAFGIGDILSPFTERDGTTALNCFVLGIDFDDGVGTSRALLVDFPNLSIMGRGEVDLRDETLNLRFASNSKTASLATFAVPFVVRGTLASPQVRADSASAVVRGAGTWLNPLAAFGTLATLGAGRALGENPCVVAMREAAVAAGEAGGDEQPSQGRGGLGGGLRRLFGLQ